VNTCQATYSSTHVAVVYTVNWGTLYTPFDDIYLALVGLVYLSLCIVTSCMVCINLQHCDLEQFAI